MVDALRVCPSRVVSVVQAHNRVAANFEDGFEWFDGRLHLLGRSPGRCLGFLGPARVGGPSGGVSSGGGPSGGGPSGGGSSGAVSGGPVWIDGSTLHMARETRLEGGFMGVGFAAAAFVVYPRSVRVVGCDSDETFPIPFETRAFSAGAGHLLLLGDTLAAVMDSRGHLVHASARGCPSRVFALDDAFAVCYEVPRTEVMLLSVTGCVDVFDTVSVPVAAVGTFQRHQLLYRRGITDAARSPSGQCVVARADHVGALCVFGAGLPVRLSAGAALVAFSGDRLAVVGECDDVYGYA